MGRYTPRSHQIQPRNDKARCCEFRLPKSAAEKYGIPHSSLCRYIHELEAGGWIEVRSMKLFRKPNEYRFALKWKGLSPSS